MRSHAERGNERFARQRRGDNEIGADRQQSTIPFAFLTVARYFEYTACVALAIRRFSGEVSLCCVSKATVAYPFAMV
jgi:hypothetical protein